MTRLGEIVPAMVRRDKGEILGFLPSHLCRVQVGAFAVRTKPVGRQTAGGFLQTSLSKILGTTRCGFHLSRSYNR